MDEDDFRAAMHDEYYEDPGSRDNRAARAAFADWLEERGDNRAEAVRAERSMVFTGRKEDRKVAFTLVGERGAITFAVSVNWSLHALDFDHPIAVPADAVLVFHSPIRLHRDDTIERSCPHLGGKCYRHETRAGVRSVAHRYAHESDGGLWDALEELYVERFVVKAAARKRRRASA